MVWNSILIFCLRVCFCQYHISVSLYTHLYTHIINKLLHGWFVCTIFIIHSLWRIATLTCQTGKLGNGAPDFFPDINFCALGISNFLWGKIFVPLNAPLSMAARLHSARLYHGRHNNWINRFQMSIFIWHVHCSICFCAPYSPWACPWVRFFAPALRFDSSCAPEISSKTAQFSSLAHLFAVPTCSFNDPSQLVNKNRTHSPTMK